MLGLQINLNTESNDKYPVKSFTSLQAKRDNLVDNC